MYELPSGAWSSQGPRRSGIQQNLSLQKAAILRCKLLSKNCILGLGAARGPEDQEFKKKIFGFQDFRIKSVLSLKRRASHVHQKTLLPSEALIFLNSWSPGPLAAAVPKMQFLHNNLHLTIAAFWKLWFFLDSWFPGSLAAPSPKMQFLHNNLRLKAAAFWRLWFF